MAVDVRKDEGSEERGENVGVIGQKILGKSI